MPEFFKQMLETMDPEQARELYRWLNENGDIYITSSMSRVLEEANEGEDLAG